MKLRDYLRVLYAHWVLIVIFTALGAGTGVAVTFWATPQYEAQAKLYVSVQTDSQASGDLLQGSSFARQNMATFVELATTESVLEPVSEELALGASPRVLAEIIDVSAPTDSTLIDVNVTDEDPQRAADIANEVGIQMSAVVEGELEAPQGDGANSPVHINIVETAHVPEDPVTPRPRVNLALGIFLGLTVGVGIAVLRTVLDTRIRSTEDVQRIIDVPILGRIANDPKVKHKPLIVHLDPRSPQAEAFRTLRTNVQFLSIGKGPESFVVSSSGPGEGKTTTATNLALALADIGLKVALVDCDLRKPRIAEYMGLEGAAGLTDILIGRADISDVLQGWGKQHLHVLPAGQLPPNPSELLGSDEMDAVLQALEHSMDVIILDAPPVPVVTDAVVIGAKTQGVIFVAAAGLTKKDGLEAAVDSFETAGVRVRGIVMTRLPTRGPGAYEYGSYLYAADDKK